MSGKEKIIITGANGVIGQILTSGLGEEYQITSLDLPEGDVRKYEALASAASGHSAIIHLAWDTKTDNFLSEKINLENSQMFFYVYKSALENGVKRVIVASSVHADRFYEWKGPGYMSPYQLPNPDSPYGAHKVFMESLGRWFASKGLEVVCIRFGGITPVNKANKNHSPERAAFLSQRDGVSLIKSILEAQSVPNNFAIVYGVSNSDNRIHDVANPFGWVPQDKAEDFLD